MNASVTRLHLLIPGLLGPMRNFDSSGVTLSAPRLEKILSRADQRSCCGEDYLTTLFALFDHPLSRERDLPEGAVNYYATGADVADACWIRADPVHLRPDRDRLLLFNCEQMEITASEAEEIARQFNAHFAEEGFQLLTAGPERWYLKLKHCPELKTHGLSQVVGHHIEPFMPEGHDARRWRQLLNEMQMLLFQSPVNQQREAEGRLTINGLWLSGIGQLPEVKQSRFDKVCGDDPTAVGMARLAKVQTEPVAVHELPCKEGEENLMVLTDLVSPVLNADPYRWSDAITVLDRRIGLLADGLQRIKKSQLVLYPCNGDSYRVTAGLLRRFWLRTKKLPALLPKSN
ncbi:MAG: hypothetical protein ABFS39_03560 [Pseudomonadota bacterium]